MSTDELDEWFENASPEEIAAIEAEPMNPEDEKLMHASVDKEMELLEIELMKHLRGNY